MILSARCISKAWVCDGDSDCEDNSDEDNCEALVCKLSHHMCATNDSICLPAEKLCDGTDDCPDGSDEKLCGKKCFTRKTTTQQCVQYLMVLSFTFHTDIPNSAALLSQLTLSSLFLPYRLVFIG